MVDQPDGGPGTAAGAASAAGPAGDAPAAGAAPAAEAGRVAAAMAATGTVTMSASLPGRHRRITDLMAGGTCSEELVMTSLPHPAPWLRTNRKVSYLWTESNLALPLRQQGQAFKSCKHDPARIRPRAGRGTQPRAVSPAGGVGTYGGFDTMTETT